MQTFYTSSDHDRHPGPVCTTPAPYAVTEKSRNETNDKSGTEGRAGSYFRYSSSSLQLSCVYEIDNRDEDHNNFCCQFFKPQESIFKI